MIDQENKDCMVCGFSRGAHKRKSNPKYTREMHPDICDKFIPKQCGYCHKSLLGRFSIWDGFARASFCSTTCVLRFEMDKGPDTVH